MMKGNEKDCICANNGKHTERCDAYRLSRFLRQAAVIALDQPTSEDYEKMNETIFGKPETTHEKEEKLRKGAKRFAEDFTETMHELAHEKGMSAFSAELVLDNFKKDIVSHEKDFIEEALQEYRKTFVRRKIGHFPFDSSLVFNDVETFLKEKLTSARNSCKDKSGMYHLGYKEGYERGRLAMKEEILSELVQMQDSVTIPEPMKLHDRTYEGNLYLATLKTVWAAIRNKK